MTILRYLTVGGSAAFIEFVIFYSLYTGLRLNLFVANCVAIGVVITYGFLFQKHWTFKNGDPSGRQIVLFAFQVMVAIILNNLLIYFFIKILLWPPAVSKVLQIGLVFFWNYSFCRLVVFPVQKPAVN
jgi:putative flippase GtrA